MLDLESQQGWKAERIQERMDAASALKKGESVDLRGRQISQAMAAQLSKSTRYRADAKPGRMWLAAGKERNRKRAARNTRTFWIWPSQWVRACQLKPFGLAGLAWLGLAELFGVTCLECGMGRWGVSKHSAGVWDVGCANTLARYLGLVILGCRVGMGGLELIPVLVWRGAGFL